MHPQERAELLCSMHRWAAIPPRYATEELNICRGHAGWDSAYNAIMAKISERKDGFVIAICGPRGTGKTRLAIEAIRSVIEQQMFFARYTVLENYLAAIRRPDYQQDDQCEPFFAPRVLVVDEVAKSGDSAWVESKLFHLVNTRYSDLKHTILICAAHPTDIPSIVGPSVYDRLHEGGGIIHCDWPSFRGFEQ